MPVISAFYGILVRMYYRDHGVPHFHAEYQGQQAVFTMSGQILAGTLRSRTALRLIGEWAIAHRSQLEANWVRACSGEPLERIEPLE
jgi:hypothetical protein